MGNNAMNASTGKPATAGAIYRAVRTANLVIPTTPSATLSADYKCLGYVSEDGLKNNIEKEFEDIKAWGGDTVYTVESSQDDKFQFTLLEVLNEDVLKAVFVDSNVTVTDATTTAPKSIAVNVNSTQTPECVWVIDMIMRGNNPKRIVIPYGKVVTIGEITYKDDEAVGYDVTIAATPDENGNTHYEYMTVGTATT